MAASVAITTTMAADTMTTTCSRWTMCPGARAAGPTDHATVTATSMTILPVALLMTSIEGLVGAQKVKLSNL